MVVLILAAGYATRLYPYTLNTPKPLLTVSGRPIINYIADEARKLPGVKKILVVTNDRFCGQFEKWREEYACPHVKILNDGTNSVETRLGAVGDMRFAVECEDVDEDLTVIAGDNLFTYSLADMYTRFNESGGDLICVKTLDDETALKSLGVCVLGENNRVIGFKEKPERPESNIAVYATYIFKRDSLRFIGEFLSLAGKNDAPGYFIEWLHKKTDIYAWFMNGECHDIGTVEAYERIRDNFSAL